MDELTRKIFTSNDEELERLIGLVAPGDEALAGFLSCIWYRTLYAEDPPADLADTPAERKGRRQKKPAKSRKTLATKSRDAPLVACRQLSRM